MTEPVSEPGQAAEDHDGVFEEAGPPGMPRWVKVAGAVTAAVVAALILVMLLVGGEHGPGRHLPSNADGSTAPGQSEEATGHQPPEGHAP